MGKIFIWNHFGRHKIRIKTKLLVTLWNSLRTSFEFWKTRRALKLQNLSKHGKHPLLCTEKSQKDYFLCKSYKGRIRKGKNISPLAKVDYSYKKTCSAIYWKNYGFWTNNNVRTNKTQISNASRQHLFFSYFVLNFYCFPESLNEHWSHEIAWEHQTNFIPPYSKIKFFSIEIV